MKGKDALPPLAYGRPTACSSAVLSLTIAGMSGCLRLLLPTASGMASGVADLHASGVPIADRYSEYSVLGTTEQRYARRLVGGSACRPLTGVRNLGCRVLSPNGGAHCGQRRFDLFGSLAMGSGAVSEASSRSASAVREAGSAA